MKGNPPRGLVEPHSLENMEERGATIRKISQPGLISAAVAGRPSQMATACYESNTKEANGMYCTALRPTHT